MSDQLFPEDILNARQSLLALARAAKQAADEETAREHAREADALIAEIWNFVTFTLGLPDYMLEDVSFEIEHAQHQSRPQAVWAMDGVRFRARYASGSDGPRAHFEVNTGGHLGGGWKMFHDMVSLGRLIG
jgi:hypothetical protein